MTQGNIKFSIVIPTYNRPELLQKCIGSVIKQSYNNWEIIIIDDSTNTDTYDSLKMKKLDHRIKYIKNKTNTGANYSRNVGIAMASGDFIIFLDDDDEFNINCLLEAKKQIETHKQYNWFVSNKVDKNNKNFTKVVTYNKSYSYILDYLLGSKVDGDCTHCISTKLIGTNRFPTDVKNGGEWEFFAVLGAKERFYTYNFPSTIVEYLDDGLTNSLNISIFMLKTKLKMIKILPKIEPKIPLFFLYMTTFLSMPPIIYIYDITKKILRRFNLLLSLKELLTKK